MLRLSACARMAAAKGSQAAKMSRKRLRCRRRQLLGWHLMDPKISIMLGTIVQELSLAVYSAETSDLQEWCCSTPRVGFELYENQLAETRMGVGSSNRSTRSRACRSERGRRCEMLHSNRLPAGFGSSTTIFTP